MCDCIWRSFVGDDENVEANDSVDYHTTYRFINQSTTHGHPGLIALIVHFSHKAGRIGNPTRRCYSVFYVEPESGQSKLLEDIKEYLADSMLCGAYSRRMQGFWHNKGPFYQHRFQGKLGVHQAMAGAMHHRTCEVKRACFPKKC